MLAVLAMISLISIPAIACDDNDPYCTSFGVFDISSTAMGGAIDTDSKSIVNGGSFGIGAAGGLAHSNAIGFTWNGMAKGDVTAVGGGLTNTESYKFKLDGTDRSNGIGSYTQNQAIAGASVKVKVKKGIAFGEMCGITGQFSLNESHLGEAPYFNTNGHTFGVAGQGSLGLFHGNVCARCFGKDSAKAEIESVGYSYSESYRYLNKEDGVRTEGMGTLVGAGTEVNTLGRNATGGFVAAGGAKAVTKQYNSNGFAKAKAAGMYVGSGALNCNFNGTAEGYTGTTVTTVKGMNGTIVSAGSGMKVTARSSN